MDDSVKDPKSDSTPGSQGIGGSFVGRTGIIALAAYLVVLSALMFYILIKIWPRSTPSGSPAVSPTKTSLPGTSALAPSATLPGSETNEPAKPVGNSENPAGAQTNITPNEQPTQISLFWGLWNLWLWNETRLLLIVILAGAFGSLLHAIRSFYWYVGNRYLKWSWATAYLLSPFVGAILAMLFYFVVRGGFFSSQSTVNDTSPFAFAAFSGLVGLFSPQAVEKLRQVATTVFASPPEAEDHVGGATAPKIASVAPTSGPMAGGTLVTIVGERFQTNAAVLIGGLSVSKPSITATAITAATPPHDAGKVDIEVTNPDNQKAVLSGRFTYV